MRKMYVYTLCALFLALLCAYSADCSAAIRSALTLCLNSAVPSLFPFFAASSLAVSCGLAHDLGKLFSPLMRKVFHLPGCAASAMVLGFLGGYPAGARMAAELHDAGLCTQKESSAIASCCNNTGPAFLIGMCGTGLFGSVRAGLFLYAVHILSALLSAFLLRPKELPHPNSTCTAPMEIPFSRCLTQSVLSAGRSCLMVSAFILFFSVLLELMRKTGIFAAAAMCTAVFPSNLSIQGVCSLLTGMLELTQGLSGMTAVAGGLSARLTAVSFLCAFGGASVLFQTAAVSEKLHIAHCVRGKCLHAVVAAILCRIMLSFFPSLP